MDAAQWAKDVRNDETSSYNNQGVQDKKQVKPQQEHALNCPRCNSTNTKFCYYNNYSLTQPRYFCKACKRYWTKGGSLRSVPVGGGSRKNKRSSSSTSKPIDLSHFSSQNFNSHEAQHLNLGSHQDYHHGFSQFLKLPKIENANASFLSSSSSPNLTCNNNGLNGTAADPTNVNTMFNGPRFSLQDFKPTMSFPFQGHQEDGEIRPMMTMLPFGVLNQQHLPRDHLAQSMALQANSNAYSWNGTMGEGGSSTLYN